MTMDVVFAAAEFPSGEGHSDIKPIYGVWINPVKALRLPFGSVAAGGTLPEAVHPHRARG